jgi:hypothetical protein
MIHLTSLFFPSSFLPSNWLSLLISFLFPPLYLPTSEQSRTVAVGWMRHKSNRVSLSVVDDHREDRQRIALLQAGKGRVSSEN